MKKLIVKSGLYFFLLLLCLEVLVRVFHLAKDTPTRYVDDYQVEKWKPNQSGYSVTGNRRQNFSEFHINEFGFNSYREFKPLKNKFEVALVGDSFIEGFHQNYYNSIGKKIESKMDTISVFEYGYAGYDMADQLHLISQYKDQFKYIDVVVLGLKYENDLFRDKYEVEKSRMSLESPLNRALKHCKLLVYAKSIGALKPITDFVANVKNFRKEKSKKLNSREVGLDDEVETRIENLNSLINLYGFNKTKFCFLLDEAKTPDKFLDYLKTKNYKYIEIGKKLEESNRNTTLIYDMHWNNNGRNIVADEIVDYIKNENLK